MQLEVSTVYDKKRLVRLSDYVHRSKTFLWWIMGICTFLVCGDWIASLILQLDTSSLRFPLTYIIVFDVLYLFLAFLLPRLTVKKAKNLDSEVTYCFTEENIQTTAKNRFVDENSIVRYDILTKIARNKSDLYLFVSRYQASIVDISGLSPDETAQLKAFLQTKVKPKKFKWK